MLKGLDERLKKLTTLDILLARLSAVVAGIFVVKLFPDLIRIDYWILIVIILALGVKPLYVVWVKK